MKKILSLLKKILIINVVVIAFLFSFYFFLLKENKVDVINNERSVEKLATQQKAPVYESCSSPSLEIVEAHFKDETGSKPVEADFDTVEGAICGNGKTFYCSSRNRGKIPPLTWISPPLPNTDDAYKGPSPFEEFKESPYAMPASKRVFERSSFVDYREPEFKKIVQKKLNRPEVRLGVLGAAGLYEEFTLKHKAEQLSIKHFSTSDEKQLEEILSLKGVTHILFDRTAVPVMPWAENSYDSLLIRFRDVLEMDLFHPLVIGSGTVLYRVGKPFKLSREDKVSLTSYTRKLMKGESPEELELGLKAEDFDMPYFRTLVSLRWRSHEGLKGRKFVKRVARGKTLTEALRNSTKKISKDWDKVSLSVIRNKSLMVTNIPDTLSDAIDDMEIEIDVFYNTTRITDKKVENVRWNMELGLHGLLAREKGKTHYLEPSHAVHMEIKSEVQFLEEMLKKANLKKYLRTPKMQANMWRGRVLHERAWEKDDKLEYSRFRTINWIEESSEVEKDKAGTARDIVELYRGVPFVSLEQVTKKSLIESLRKGAEWLVRYQSEDGQYAYKYTPTNKPEKRWEAGGNIVRHALNPYTLLMVYKVTKDPRYLESAKRGIDFTLSFLRKEGDRCVVCHRDPPAPYYNAKIGTVAVTILSILKLGEVEDISEYHDVLKCFGEELLYMQDPNGHYRLYDVPEEHPYYAADNTIAPGEIIFALSRLHTYFKDARYKSSIDLALPWYMDAWRHYKKRTTKSGIYNEEDRTNLIGIVPWMVTAMNDLHKTTGEKKYADIAAEQQDWIDETFFYYAHRSKYPDYAGASFKMHYELPAINSCQYAEGAAAAYDMALRTGKKDLERMREVVLYSMRFCLQLQFSGYGDSFFIPVPEEVFGGYRYTTGHLRLRNDYSYHAMAAIAQAVEYLREEDYALKNFIK